MDKFILESELFRRFAARYISKMIRKKTGFKSDIKLHGLKVEHGKEETTAFLQVSVTAKDEELKKLFKRLEEN